MLLDLETEEIVKDADQAAADEIFDAELEKAAAGDWEALGLDPPPPAGATQTFQPQSIEDFLKP